MGNGSNDYFFTYMSFNKNLLAITQIYNQTMLLYIYIYIFFVQPFVHRTK